MVGKLLHWFYCLDLPVAALVLVLGTAAFLLIRHFVPRWRWIAGGALTLCVPVILQTTLWRNGEGTPMHSLQLFQSYRDAVITGNVEIYRSNFMNVVLFYPAGLLAASLLMRKWPEWCRLILVVTVLAALSAGIEFLQYHFRLGRCEIDDVIHNTAGALLGCLAAMVLPRLLASIKGTSEVNKLK